MSTWTEWMSADVLKAMALTLLHFLWQGAALAALAGVALAACKRASTRYVIAVAALAAMAVAPVATFVLVRGSSAADEAAVDVGGSVLPTAQQALAHVDHRLPNPPSRSSLLPATTLVWLVQIWFAGVLLFSVRTAGGLVVIARMRRLETAPVSEELLAMCRELQKKMGLTRAIRYCESLRLDAPAVAGWMRPVVFLPATALTGLSEAQLKTVIAHELAHVQRLDGLVNLLQIAVETLLFYHPGVWWMSRRIRTEREHCCDDAAIAVCGNAVEYARALTLMEEWRTAPALALAANGNPLAARVARLLGITRAGSGLRSAGIAAGVLCLTAALLAGNALFGGTQAPSEPQQAPAAADDASFVVSAPKPAKVAKAPKAKPSVAPTAEVEAVPAPAPMPSATPSARPVPAPVAVAPVYPVLHLSPAPQANPTPSGSYIEQMKAAGVENLRVDDLVAMKIQGITPDYVRLMKELGIAPNADELIGMKVQGITPDYVREMRAATGQNLGADELIGLKVQGVNAEYIKQLKELGLKTDGDDVIGLKVQGVTAAYIKEMRAMGLKVDSDEVIGMKVQGITPEYVKSMQDLGFKPSSDELIGMKVQGITAAYLKEMQAAGFKMDIDDAISAKVQGVTPAFIAKAKSYGFKDLTLEQIIRLKQSGVLDRQAEK